MMKQQFYKPILVFILLLVIIVVMREQILSYYIQTGELSYLQFTAIGAIINLLLIILALFFINKHDLRELSGLSRGPFIKAYLLLFPLLYLCMLNLLTSDGFQPNLQYLNLLMLLVYVVSVGFSEELTIRGFLQSYLIKHSSKTKKGIILSIFAASLFFGIIHLLKFDKGIYGEISQIFYATFIGVCFGALLIITKRLYPLILIHSAINFCAELDSAGMPIKQSLEKQVSLDNSMIIILLVLPCLLYGVFLLKKYRIEA